MSEHDLRPGDPEIRDRIRRGRRVPVHPLWSGYGCPFCNAEQPEAKYDALERELDWFQSVSVDPCWYCGSRLNLRKLPGTDEEFEAVKVWVLQFCGCSHVQRFEQNGTVEMEVSSTPGFDAEMKCRCCRRPSIPAGCPVRPPPRDGDYDHGETHRATQALADDRMTKYLEAVARAQKKVRDGRS